jgi:hypothetical protein
MLVIVEVNGRMVYFEIVPRDLNRLTGTSRSTYVTRHVCDEARPVELACVIVITAGEQRKVNLESTTSTCQWHGLLNYSKYSSWKSKEKDLAMKANQLSSVLLGGRLLVPDEFCKPELQHPMSL